MCKWWKLMGAGVDRESQASRIIIGGNWASWGFRRGAALNINCLDCFLKESYHSRLIVNGIILHHPMPKKSCAPTKTRSEPTLLSLDLTHVWHTSIFNLSFRCPPWVPKNIWFLNNIVGVAQKVLSLIFGWPVIWIPWSDLKLQSGLLDHPEGRSCQVANVQSLPNYI